MRFVSPFGYLPKSRNGNEKDRRLRRYAMFPMANGAYSLRSTSGRESRRCSFSERCILSILSSIQWDHRGQRTVESPFLTHSSLQHLANPRSYFCPVAKVKTRATLCQCVIAGQYRARRQQVAYRMIITYSRRFFFKISSAAIKRDTRFRCLYFARFIDVSIRRCIMRAE